jgi:hypothetical protein
VNGIGECEDDDDHHPPTASLLSGTIPKEVDSVIAKQSSVLSVQDREKAYMDVHGLSDLVEETPEMAEVGLVQLESEILLLKDNAAYDLAESMNPSYTVLYCALPSIVPQKHRMLLLIDCFSMYFVPVVRSDRLASDDKYSSKCCTGTGLNRQRSWFRKHHHGSSRSRERIKKLSASIIFMIALIRTQPRPCCPAFVHRNSIAMAE